ncbi:polysaccharide pyruvyl transferase family protein [Sphingomonas baiyangensis]|uniref:polysaccharide pyruvyl transferase family protein n=1 Tax=Sphingomonas baiyangensis TaxID=2572576 RepID=UPI00146BC211|nr:polysaccharide pyruvyl transferase family protein [Sphingomonas baiyangensis]
MERFPDMGERETSGQATGGREIVLVTRMTTGNQGNQALSIALRDFLAESFPDVPLRLIERAPSYMRQLSAAKLGRRRDPVAAFERAAQRLVARRDASVPPPPIGDNRVCYDKAMAGIVRFEGLRSRLQLRQWMRRLGVYRRAIDERLALFAAAGRVIVNPAGEFNPVAADIALAYLLDIRCAQLLNPAVYAINLSFEVEDPVVQAISVHVFDRCRAVAVREEASVAHYAAAGGTRTPVMVPDASTLHRPKAKLPAIAQKAGLILNYLQIANNNLVDEVTDFIAAFGREHPGFVLTSNEWATDIPLWKARCEALIPATSPEGTSYERYMEELAGYDLIVSSRLHTCALAIVAGTPVVPIEIGTFKITEFFANLGLADGVVRIGDAGWAERTLARARTVEADPATVAREQAAAMLAAGDGVRRQLRAILT